MELRRLLRGTIEWERLEAVGLALAERADSDGVRIRFLNTDNWLSTPCVIDDRWFVKIVSTQNALVHALFTTGRNLGAFSSGTEGFFERFDGPVEMAQHELEATRKIRDLGINAPEPIEVFEVEDLGVLVFEYLPDYRALDETTTEEVLRFAPELFDALSTMHDARLAHGDLRAENVLISHGNLYFIDATSVDEQAISDARSYDLACALAVLTPLIGCRAAVAAALEHYDRLDLLAAREFLDFVSLRPDHDFDAALVKGEIEKRAS